MQELSDEEFELLTYCLCCKRSQLCVIMGDPNGKKPNPDNEKLRSRIDNLLDKLLEERKPENLVNLDNQIRRIKDDLQRLRDKYSEPYLEVLDDIYHAIKALKAEVRKK